LNFHVEPDHVLSVYKNIGENYGERIIAPAVQESVKAVTAEFNAEELITKRPVVKEKIGTALADRLRAYGIITDALSITNFQFSSEFTSAIEQKVVAEQQALQAKNVLEQRKYEAQQLIETAKGNAEAMQINNEQLAKSDKVLLMRLIDKWNGVMPLVIVSGSGQSPGLLMNLAAGNLGAMNMTTAYQNASG
jgi:regulator of protease activity HflC (stomatin/prohibitin superfamily)